MLLGSASQTTRRSCIFSDFLLLPHEGSKLGVLNHFGLVLEPEIQKKCSIQQKLLFFPYKKITLPKTNNNSHLKMDGWKTIVPFFWVAGYRPIFKGKLAVRFEALPPAVVKSISGTSSGRGASILWFRCHSAPPYHPFSTTWKILVYCIHAYNTSGITNRSIPPSPPRPLEKRKIHPRKLTWNPKN